MTDYRENILAVNRRFCEVWGLPTDIVTLGMSHIELESLALSGGSRRSRKLRRSGHGMGHSLCDT